jgi:hypothetical protein
LISAFIVSADIAMLAYMAICASTGHFANSAAGISGACVFIALSPIVLRDYIAITFSVITRGTTAIYIQDERLIYISPQFFSVSVRDLAPVSLGVGVRSNTLILAARGKKRRFVQWNFLAEDRKSVLSAINELHDVETTAPSSEVIH